MHTSPEPSPCTYGPCVHMLTAACVCSYTGCRCREHYRRCCPRPRHPRRPRAVVIAVLLPPSPCCGRCRCHNHHRQLSRQSSPPIQPPPPALKSLCRRHCCHRCCLSASPPSLALSSLPPSRLSRAPTRRDFLRILPFSSRNPKFSSPAAH